MNFLDKLPKTQRDILVRKVTAMESGQKPKPKTQADVVRDELRRTLGRRKTYLTGEKIDYNS